VGRRRLSSDSVKAARLRPGGARYADVRKVRTRMLSVVRITHMAFFLFIPQDVTNEPVVFFAFFALIPQDVTNGPADFFYFWICSMAGSNRAAFDVFPFRFVQFYFRLLAHSSEGGLSPRVQVVAGDLSVFIFRLV